MNKPTGCPRREQPLPTAKAEEDLRGRLRARVRHDRLWSLGTAGEQLELQLDRTGSDQ
jgi:hypothetical protein